MVTGRSDETTKNYSFISTKDRSLALAYFTVKQPILPVSRFLEKPGVIDHTSFMDQCDPGGEEPPASHSVESGIINIRINDAG